MDRPSDPLLRTLTRRSILASALCALCSVCAVGGLGPAPARAAFVNFESQHVHPIALGAAGDRLYVVNTPDNRLAAFDLADADAPALLFEVVVGLEPVTVREENAERVWVVNHLSDDISIVDVTTRNVVRTVGTGDEPTDLLFTPDPAADGQQLAWVCVSQENRVEIYDAETPGAPLRTVRIPASDPRAMAYDPARGRVYVAVFESGNGTTIVPRSIRADSSGPWGGSLPPFDPPLNPDLTWIPDNGLVVDWTGTDWVDEQGGVWTSLVPWRVGDVDVVALSTTATPAIVARIEGVGTLLFDVAVNPTTGDVYVTNTEARNAVLFEPKLKGRIVNDRLTRIPGGTGAPEIHDVNPHVNYAIPAGSAAERALSLSQPGQIAISADGEDVYYSAIGSALIGVSDASGARVGEIAYEEGATGLALDEARDRLYVVNRFTNEVAVFGTTSRALVGEAPIGKSGFDPTPPVVRDGRRFLYAGVLSAHGDASCASCHPFSHFDNLSWDLGDPSGVIVPSPPPEQNGGVDVNDFHPLKGPMATQTLRGLLGTGFLHWRGDRNDFVAFNKAFTSLLGGPDTLSSADMQAYSDFIMTVTYPPNPLVNLDNSLATSPPDSNPAAGSQIFQFTNELDCDGCHLMQTGTNGLIFPLDLLPGFGGQVMKVPQLRNLYEKTGFELEVGENQRGFGFLHDGGFHSLQEFVEEPVTRLDPIEQPHMIAFLLSFPTGTAAAVGHQVTTKHAGGAPSIPAELPVMQDQAVAGNIDLIVKGLRAGEQRGYWFDVATGLYEPDRVNEPQLGLGALLGGAGVGTELTFTGVPPLCGERIGIDRDEDGYYDRDEIDFGSDPADPSSIPSVVGVETGGAASRPRATRIVSISPNPFNPLTRIRFEVAERSLVAVAVFAADGRLVKRVAQSVVDAGEHEVRWDGRNDRGESVASGVYLVALRAGDRTDSKKAILAR